MDGEIIDLDSTEEHSEARGGRRKRPRGRRRKPGRRAMQKARRRKVLKNKSLVNAKAYFGNK